MSRLKQMSELKKRKVKFELFLGSRTHFKGFDDGCKIALLTDRSFAIARVSKDWESTVTLFGHGSRDCLIIPQ